MSLALKRENDALDVAKLRALITGSVMQALGPAFERAGEQLADKILASFKAFQAAMFLDQSVRTHAQYAEHRDKVALAGYHAVNEAVANTLALLQQVRRAGEQR